MWGYDSNLVLLAKIIKQQKSGKVSFLKHNISTREGVKLRSLRSRKITIGRSDLLGHTVDLTKVRTNTVFTLSL